ncbi:class III lanthionine synthetase LanKC [Nocardiopsis aegyptia]|uniref:non-specific serine/threonine protein kinase n=1 Tax=Nocardiopsis aegyptia TaxID=220378 RepID=A0A7Z0EPS0_9ACTN|nr:class III lanthionine synthetase LanKC [Nocardiopsis aegyptia]NYJ35844.1 serine/threonine protein kinase [Nocardiopsis aegyptia]
MKLRYFEYCLADRLFYDEPNRWSSGEGTYHHASIPVPEGWATATKGPWFNFVKKDTALREQGWKVHVSANRETAQKVLDITADYCFANGIAFKFLAGESALISRNLKYADRGGSGKFVTIYPEDDAQLQRVLEELEGPLDGLGGAYILSDLRWKEGPLYVRYGGFSERYTRNELGEPVPAIEAPDGELVPDKRDPVFTCPDWVTVPDFLRPAVEERFRSRAPEGFPYTIDSALHFSNGGGIYLATRRDDPEGAKVVLKEARPHAGLDQIGRDAVSRLKREYEFLRKLADVDTVVGAHDYFELWEHHFLVQEYVEGTTLNKEMVARLPLIRPHQDDEALAEYTTWALDVAAQVESAVSGLHRAGIAFGDLHPNNVLLREDGRVCLVDFEISTYTDSEQRIGMGAPGFVPPDEREAVAADRYALACIKLALFLPVTVLLTLDARSAPRLVEEVEQRFPVPEGWGEGVLADIDLGPSTWAGTEPEMERSHELILGGGERRPDWPALEEAVGRGVWANATPHRNDRLFPGDVGQFDFGGLGMAYGAAGVLYAMDAAGQGRRPEHEDWLVRRVREHRGPHRLGFYDGLHGIAFALDSLGRTAEAHEFLETAQSDGQVAMSHELFGGLSGVALNRLHFAGRLDDQELLGQALRDADEIADRLRHAPPPVIDEQGRHRRAGLLYGSSGSALLFLRLYDATGDEAHLDAAALAIEHDLETCIHSEEDDTLLSNEGWRSMPYVGTGSAGIGVVITEYLRHRANTEFATALGRIRRAAEPEFCVCPILFHGTAGQMGFLAHLRDPGAPDPSLDRAVEAQRDHLRRHMVGLRGDIAFPGDQLMRLSMDLGTGGAGILLALAAVRDDRRPMLPFLTRH